MLKKCVLWVLVIFISTQIFSFSKASAKTSSETSKKVTTEVFDIAKKIFNIPEEKLEEAFHTCHVIVRKAAHFAEFLVLAFFVAALCRSYGIRFHITFVITMLYILLFAITDEVHQLFVDGRSGQISDVCIDFSGGLAGYLGFLIIHKICLFFIQTQKSN
jgi:VanZ family protein